MCIDGNGKMELLFQNPSKLDLIFFVRQIWWPVICSYPSPLPVPPMWSHWVFTFFPGSFLLDRYVVQINFKLGIYDCYYRLVKQSMSHFRVKIHFGASRYGKPSGGLLSSKISVSAQNWFVRPKHTLRPSFFCGVSFHCLIHLLFHYFTRH